MDDYLREVIPVLPEYLKQFNAGGAADGGLLVCSCVNDAFLYANIYFWSFEHYAVIQNGGRGTRLCCREEQRLFLISLAPPF